MGPPRGECLFDVRTSQGRPVQGPSCYNTPHIPRPVNPGRKIKKVRDEDVRRILVRVNKCYRMTYSIV
jgi:hypothetical protein